MIESINKPPALRLHPDELIVDNFAGGGGASLGIEWALGRSPDIAINHDPEAIAMHQANHPHTRHYREDVFAVDPVAVCGGRPVGLAWFSPDCTYHSKARGGKPFRDRNKARRRRGLAWVVVKWARLVKPRIIMLENVEEFADWGPLLEDGKPDPARRGFTFRRWRAQLENLGYQVDYRELRACDFGAPTTRKRLFLIARCDGQAIVWPKPTHRPAAVSRDGIVTAWAKGHGLTLADLQGLPVYRTAAECIDWSIPTHSIFLSREDGRAVGVKRPLAEKTMLRIARGLQRYVIDAPEPFIVSNMTNNVPRPVSEPVSTILTGNHKYLVAPTLIQTGYGERPGQAPRSLDLHQPLGTIMAGGGKHALVAAFLAKHYTGVVGSQLSLPLDTITSVDHHSLVASHLVKLRGGLDTHHTTAQAMETPVPTITAGGTHLAEVRAFLIKYYGTDGDPQLKLPLHTITTVDRFGLVIIHGEPYAIADICMRMLSPRELFRAQGFPDSYQIAIKYKGKPLSKEAQTRMCGNSVSPYMPLALIAANVGEARRVISA